MPFAIRQQLGAQLAEIARWPNQNIANAIQQLVDLAEGDSSVQILSDVLEQCKRRITTVPNRGEDAIRRGGDFVGEGDRGLNQTQRRDFCMKVREGIHNYTNAQIQQIGPSVSQAILAELRSSCDQFSNEVGTQLDFLGMFRGNSGRREKLGTNRRDQN